MIQFSEEQLQIMYAHAESSYPEECCGIIFGNLGEQGKTVVEVEPTENAWSPQESVIPGDGKMYSKLQRYAIAPQVMFQAQKSARERNLEIIGIYHSHPNNPAIPSESDRAGAWQAYSYIIISLHHGRAEDIASWVLDDYHQFQPEEMKSGSLVMG